MSRKSIVGPKPGSPSSAKWYILRTEPQADHLAETELRRAGFEVFAPRVKTPDLKDVNAYKFAPLFPGYLFMRCDLERSGKPSLSNAPHVAGWVSFEGTVPPVPDEVVTKLAAQVDAMNAESGLWRRFRSGEKVRVVSKAIESLAEVLEEAKTPQSNVKVIMYFMGRLVSAQVPWSILQPVPEPEGYDGAKDRPARRTRGRGRWIRGFGPYSSYGLQHAARP